MSGKKQHGPVRACLITNARSAHGVDLDEVLPGLFEQGWEVTVREKTDKGEAAKFASAAAADGYDPIVNCGGDGTLNEIVGALVGTGVGIGTIPGGTENVWSKEIGVSQRARVAAVQLAASRRVKVDVGLAEIDGKHAGHFLMMAGLGADASVMGRVSRPLKNRLGPLAVGVAAVESLPSLRSSPVRLVMDGVHWEGRISQLIAGNTRRYGGFTQITPDAYADDGLLDVCVFTTDGPFAAIRQLSSVLLRQHPSGASAEPYRAASVLVCAQEQLPLQLDGSAVDQNPGTAEVEYRFTVIPHGVTVLVPRTYDGSILEHGLSAKKSKKQRKKGK